MSESPQTNGDSGGGRFNGVVVVLLVIVGIAGVGFMVRSMYSSAPSPAKAPELTKEAPPAPPPAGSAPLSQDPAPRAGATRHAIQLSPYSEVATAEDVRAKLDKLGIPSSLRIEAHVLVGPFNTPQEAEATRAKLKELGVYGGQAITLKP